MRILAFLSLVVLTFSCTKPEKEQTNKFQTSCNPVNISYRFRPEVDQSSRREAADPSVIKFKGEYWLFASKSGGYWHSRDLVDWFFVECNEIPTEEYAPTPIAIGDTLYFLASSREKSTIYKTTDPKSGKWTVAKEELEEPVWDPAFWLEDGRLYMYWGCSNETPIWGVELNYKNDFSFMGKPEELIFAKPEKYGWEVPGDYNTRKETAPWIEGAWMNKYEGKYYLQYSGPGTEFKSYADGVYTSDSPLGIFELQAHNPFAYRPEGFATGAGHGSTFTDDYGNYWHIGTVTISQKHMFERRLALFPTFFETDGTMHAVTKYGDYPFIVPTKKVNSFDELFPGWMLLSYNKTVKVSSEIETQIAENMCDEDIRTYWAAKTGNVSEWASIDLEKECAIYALQINFAEHNTKIYNRQANLKHRYSIEASNNEMDWVTIVDKSKHNNDNSHAYIQLEEMGKFRYVRIKNIEVPGGSFALSGFRVFGLGGGAKIAIVENFQAIRNATDKRDVTLKWEKSPTADGYNIRYGVASDKLFQNYMIYDKTELTIRSLNTNQNYYFAIEAFNENGISTLSKTVK